MKTAENATSFWQLAAFLDELDESGKLLSEAMGTFGSLGFANPVR